ncbi:hypothetical protein HMI54_015324 [Coelomomyces lativittatus]|nr:hypothetical protein HMI56_000395 [Coelomomyces lativittatus]KAJ1512960.1 hypothetical protein HMI54_015324 [Coelomomyces lativittatus]KAJ1514344.1 hypothetical protein HMI55_004746 [Coelomomyces lativittatus]
MVSHWFRRFILKATSSHPTLSRSLRNPTKHFFLSFPQFPKNRFSTMAPSISLTRPSNILESRDNVSSSTVIPSPSTFNSFVQEAFVSIQNELKKYPSSTPDATFLKVFLETCALHAKSVDTTAFVEVLQQWQRHNWLIPPEETTLALQILTKHDPRLTFSVISQHKSPLVPSVMDLHHLIVQSVVLLFHSPTSSKVSSPLLLEKPMSLPMVMLATFGLFPHYFHTPPPMTAAIVFTILSLTHPATKFDPAWFPDPISSSKANHVSLITQSIKCEWLRHRGEIDSALSTFVSLEESLPHADFNVEEVFFWLPKSIFQNWYSNLLGSLSPQQELVFLDFVEQSKARKGWMTHFEL